MSLSFWMKVRIRKQRSNLVATLVVELNTGLLIASDLVSAIRSSQFVSAVILLSNHSYYGTLSLLGRRSRVLPAIIKNDD